MKNLRKRIWDIVEVAKPGDKISYAFDIIMLALIFANILAVILGSVASYQKRWNVFFSYFEFFK